MRSTRGSKQAKTFARASEVDQLQLRLQSPLCDHLPQLPREQRHLHVRGAGGGVQYGRPHHQDHLQGTFQFAPDKTHSYTMDMVYDTIHNITRKTQADNIIQPSGTSVLQKKVSYDFAYAYNPSGANSIQPHAPNHIGLRTFTYDADGNQTGWTHDTNGTRRNIT
jgi:hypothetical protein